ncbi:hypothetical protein F4802DRAFT_604707 [Xylaria palmicola]|nr:hypothetical protein F4802DRAFT_604707 [Xylaria palmicola]
MKHRIISRGLRAKSYGFYPGQVRLQSIVPQRFSIAAPPNATQRQVLDELSRHTLKVAENAHHGTQSTDGIAILASKEFTSWLEDETFMSAFLKALSKPAGTAQVNQPSLHVLTGITDGLGPHKLSSEPRSGFSVLRGSTDSILPGLWGKEGFAGTSQDSTACVSFVTNPLVGNTGALEVTLPLANTVFQNGRRSTLYASKWDIGDGGSMTLEMRHPKTIQRIAGKGGSVNHTSSMIPLLPLTPPRKIVAGLGNIVRQVEVDGIPAPASKELEAVIPKIFEERARHDPTSSPRPMGVWCWVVPPHLMEAKKFDSLKLFQAGASQSETDIARGSMEIFSELLSSGCRLHKILSGGGGWGLKQGLLSLDPETSFSLPGQDDDMEMFIRSFKERNSAEPTSGLATPGSYLIFCVEPQSKSTDSLSSQFLAPTNNFTFGVAPNPEDAPGPGSRAEPVETSSGHFGVSSATGLFLRTIPEFTGVSDNNGSRGNGQDSFTTKVDIPGACFYV